MPKSEEGNNSVKYSQNVTNFTKLLSGHRHLRHDLCVKYHDPSSSGSQDTLVTRSFVG